MTPRLSRRRLLRDSVGGALLGSALTRTAEAEAAAESPLSWNRPTTILFQGDSITDAARNRKNDEPNDPSALGRGYALLLAAELLAGPGGRHLAIYNRGVSGNKVYQLAERWQADCLALQPDVLSILVGVNDIWHTFVRGYQGTVETYERDYQTLLQQTREHLPQVRLVVCEPFVLPTGAVTDQWFPLFDEYRSAARRVAGAAGAVFVGLQAAFDAALSQAGPDHWTRDGVHPTLAGAHLIARTWLHAVREAWA